MVEDTQLDEMVFELFMHQKSEAVINDRKVILELSDDMRALTISTIVYEGDQFIPQSIRRGVRAECLIPYAFIKTKLAIDEDNYNVLLKFEQDLDLTGFTGFEEWFDEFMMMAKDWSFILDKYGREDLIFVYMKK